jgi:hypothetical protein
MGFPWLLLGGLAAGVPVALHFFFRSRYRVVPWAAMEFLLTSLQTTSRRLKFQELLLLLLRIDLLLLLAVALAQPLIGGRPKDVNSSLDVVLIIDNSYSMGVRAPATGETRLELAKKEAIDVINGLREDPNATVQIVVCSDGPDEAKILGPSNPNDHAAAIKLVEGIRLGHFSTNFAAGFGKAEEALTSLGSRTHAGKVREVYLFSDLRSLGWERQGQNWATLRQQTANLRAPTSNNQETRLILVRCGLESVTNAAVVNLEKLSDTPYLGEDGVFRVTVRNTGTTKITQLKVSLFVGEQLPPVEQTAADEKHPLEPKKDAKVEFRVKFAAVGPQVVTATLDPGRRLAKRGGASLEVQARIRGVDQGGNKLTVQTEDNRTLTLDVPPETEFIGLTGTPLSAGLRDGTVKDGQAVSLFLDPLKKREGKSRPQPEENLELKRVSLANDADNLGTDNSRELIVDVRDPKEERIRLLVIESDTEKPEDQSANWILKVVRTNPRIAAEKITVREARAAHLDRSDVVILTNVPAVPPLTGPEAEHWRKFLKRLEEFVKDDGKGLMIFCGPNVRPQDYNDVLGKEHGLLPARLIEEFPDFRWWQVRRWLHGSPASVPENSYLRRFRTEKVYRDLLLNEFVLVTRAIRVQELAGSAEREKAIVDLRYTDGNPAVVSRVAGKGRVILCTTTSGERWSWWPAALGLYMPLVQLSVFHLQSGDVEDFKPQESTYASRTGDPLRWTLRGENGKRSFHVLTPEGDKVQPLRREQGNGLVVLETNRTARMGVYTLRSDDDKGEGVTNLERRDRPEPPLRAVNLRLAGSDDNNPGDLESFAVPTTDFLNTQLGKENLYHWTAGQQEKRISSVRPPESRSLTPWLLGILAVLFVAELFLAWICSRSLATESKAWTATLLVLIVLVVLQMIALVTGALVMWRWPGVFG